MIVVSFVSGLLERKTNDLRKRDNKFELSGLSILWVSCFKQTDIVSGTYISENTSDAPVWDVEFISIVECKREMSINIIHYFDFLVSNGSLIFGRYVIFF